MNPTPNRPKQPLIPTLAKELIWQLRYRQSAEVAREGAGVLSEMLAAPEQASMTIVTALYASLIVHYGRIFHDDDRPYSVKRARTEPGFQPDVHDMLMNLRHKLVAHMDIDAATGGFRVVWRTISNGPQSVTAVTDFSAQATGIAGPKDKETADAIRDHTTAVASHLERAVQSAARKLAELAISDGPTFLQALRDAGSVDADHGSIDVKKDGALTMTLPDIPLAGPARPLADVAPENQLFQHLVLHVRPKGTINLPGTSEPVVEINPNVTADAVVHLQWRWLAHDTAVGGASA